LKESIFLTGYNQTNLQISKESKILGWMQNSKRKEIANGDYVFVYNMDNKRIECVFRIDSKSENNELIWKDEKDSNSVRYENRWNADLISDSLGIDRSEILNYSPFNKDVNRFNLLIRNPFPNFLDDKYDDFCSFLVTTIPTKESISTPKNNDMDMNLDAKQYFLIQVNERGSQNILENNTYRHLRWFDVPKDIDHGKVKEGDILLVYFARNSIKYKQCLKKVFLVDSVSGDKTTFNVKELKDLRGISLQDIKTAIDGGKIGNSFEKLGQQGFNIKQISESDYSAAISLDNNLYRSDDNNELNEKKQLGGPNLWLLRAGDRGQGEEIALTRGLVGIGYDGLPGLHSIKDIKAFREHYINTHSKDSIGRVNAVVPQIWKFMNEIKINDYVVLPLKTQNSKIIAVGKIVGDYQYEDLNPEIKQFRPVKWLNKDVPRDAFDPEINESFGNNGTVFHIGGIDTVNKLKEMLSRLGIKDLGETQLNKRDWLSLSDEEIDPRNEPQHTVNQKRFDPYKNFKFKVKWDGKYVAGISKMSGLKRTTEIVEHREGGDPNTIRKIPGLTRYEAIILQRGLTHDLEFENWACKVSSFDPTSGTRSSLPDFRKDIILEIFNEAGEFVMAYKIYRCWVSEYQALPDLDANANAVAIESIKIENEGWERDSPTVEPPEPDS